MDSEDQLQSALDLLAAHRTAWHRHALLEAVDDRVRAALGHLHSARLGVSTQALVESVTAHGRLVVSLIGDTCEEIENVLNAEILALRNQIHRHAGHAHDHLIEGAPEPISHHISRPVMSRAERVAAAVCHDILPRYPGYLGTFDYGTPGGSDIDLRICFTSLDKVPREEIRQRFLREMRARGEDVDIDVFFTSRSEFTEGIHERTELEFVAKTLRDGFDSHDQQVRIPDTSIFSLYIFSTMRVLHKNTDASPLPSPHNALEQLTITRDGAVDWMHFFTGCFLHEYLKHNQQRDSSPAYRERLAKFLTRVTMGSTLAQLDTPQLTGIKTDLINAIRKADRSRSTDAQMSTVLMRNPSTGRLLDTASRRLLETAGRIRNGDTSDVPPDFTTRAEELLFFHAFHQGIDRRPYVGEEADVLTGYAFSSLAPDLGSRTAFAHGDLLMTQGEVGSQVIHLPVKMRTGQDNGSVRILVRDSTHNAVANYRRTAGRVVGEGALFGQPRSATVSAEGELEAVVIDTHAVRDILSDPELQKQLTKPLVETREARRLDVLLRYSAREAGIFTRHSLPYTTLADRQVAEAALGRNPFGGYNLGQRFRQLLELHATPTSSILEQDYRAPVTSVVADSSRPHTLYEASQRISRLYVVEEGFVKIRLLDGDEVITLRQGEFFGESSMLGLTTTGAASLLEGSKVLSIDSPWFTRFTQSRQPIRDMSVPSDLQDILPVHLLYHLAAEGYDRVRRRLITQQAPLIPAESAIA